MLHTHGLQWTNHSVALYLGIHGVLVSVVQVTILIIAWCARLHGSIIVVIVTKVLLQLDGGESRGLLSLQSDLHIGLNTTFIYKTVLPLVHIALGKFCLFY